jgi:chromosome segregation ATPase
MAPQIWNPDKTLNIDAWDNNRMFCVGVAVSRGNARCCWRISGKRRNKVCLILNEMGRRPPREISGSKLLSRLAKLSLCGEQHRRQEPDVLERWEDMIEDAAEQYEEIEELKGTNRQLETKLVKERQERKQLERMLAEKSANDGMKQLSVQLGELNSQLASSHGASAIVASAQNRNKFEARESDLLLQIKEFDRELAESRALAERLTVQEAEFSRRLAESRRISAQRQQDHEVTAKQVDELQSQLSAQRQMSEQLRQDLEKATTDRKGLLAQIKSLRAQSATKSQSLNQVKRNLDEAETIQAALLKEKENLQSLLTAECQTSSQSGKKVESLETELASVRETLERTQLDLTQSRKVNEEQAATDAASRAAATAETTRLLERIRQLEEQSRFSFLNAFVGGIMGLVEHVGRWPRRENGTEVDNPRTFLLSST